MKVKKILVVGAGFSGSIIANELAKNYEFCTIDVIDERSHVGGNCYTRRDEATDIMEHVYGPHIFHTDKPDVWNYISQFVELMPFVNRVKCNYQNNIYSLPINLHTINQFYKKDFSPSEAAKFIASIADSTIDEPENFEEQALKFIGKDLYESFFKGYTIKQWGCDPKVLPASILKRLPVRFNYNDNYYNSPLQGIPKEGYTPIFEQLLDHARIKVSLNTKFHSITKEQLEEYDHIFFSGPIDAYFNYQYGKLGYRTVYFEKHIADGDYLGNAVINYTDEKIPFTRIAEHKHFAPWEQHSKTIYFKEFSKETDDGDIPYYPKRLADDKEKLAAYYQLAHNQQRTSFIGRLGTYRYLDMHQVIYESLSFSKTILNSLENNTAIPVFYNPENI